MAPRAGFEPATNRLTAGCSTTELPGNTLRTRCLARPDRHSYMIFEVREAIFPANARHPVGISPHPFWAPLDSAAPIQAQTDIARKRPDSRRSALVPADPWPLDASLGNHGPVGRLPSAAPGATAIRQLVGPAAAEASAAERLKTKKKGPGDKPGPKALGNGGVSSREDTRILPR